MNTAEFLTITSSILPDRIALVCGDNRSTYQEMQERVNKLSNALQALGVQSGDKVASMDVNSIPYVETYYACAKLGAIFVPLNYRAKNEELIHMLNTAEASVIFTGSRYINLVEKIRPQLAALRHIICYDAQKEGTTNYEALLSEYEAIEIFTEVDDGDPTILIYTSGTTAMPKGVALTYLSMSVYVTNTVEPATPEVHDVLLLSVPIFHVAGATAIMSSILSGFSSFKIFFILEIYFIPI